MKKIMWKDINTAPEDGTFVLLLFKNLAGRFILPSVSQFVEGEWMNSTSYFVNNPTHWMELPENPEY